MHDPFEIVGQTVDDTVIIDAMVGEGGFGVVYRGRHTKLREPVAVKVLKLPTSLDAAQRESFLKKFQLEARILYRLSQETLTVVRAIGFGSLETRQGWAPYCLLEWLDGQSLEQLLAARRARIAKGELTRGRPLAELVPLIDPLMEAVDKAHGIGVIHRDIKPANVFVSGSDEAPTVKLLDFGIAKLVDLSSDLAGTATLSSGTLMALTPEYAAPEQWDRDLGAPTARTDIYALGLLLLELMLDRHPHEGASASQRMFSACNPTKRPTPRRLGLDVSDAVERSFARALAVDPDERPQTASAFWNELRAAALADEGRASRTLIGGYANAAAGEPFSPGASAAALGQTLPLSQRDTGVDAGREGPEPASDDFALAPTAASQPSAEQVAKQAAERAEEEAAQAAAELHAPASAPAQLSPGVAPPRAGHRRRMLLISSIAMVLLAAVGVTIGLGPMVSKKAGGRHGSIANSAGQVAGGDTPEVAPLLSAEHGKNNPVKHAHRRQLAKSEPPVRPDGGAAGGSAAGSSARIAGRPPRRRLGRVVGASDSERHRQRHRQRLQACLKAAGRYRVAVALDQGRVKKVEITRLSGAKLSAAVDKCVRRMAKSIRWPRAARRTQIDIRSAGPPGR